ncbi:unnamed protein product [Penicillium bialowiezense]
MSPEPQAKGQTKGPPQRRQQRFQVARACDACRRRRTKCDNRIPCMSCATLAEATEEIEVLAERVKQLEKELKNRPSANQNDPRPKYQGKTYWEGTQLRPGRYANDTWLGASSLQFFIQRLSEFLGLKRSRSHRTHQLLPVSASDHQLLNRPSTGSCARREMSSVEIAGEASAVEIYLSPTQEDHFLNLFWETYHTALFPILDETQFKDHYQSLWTGGTERAPSALADIMIAMCMQFGISTLPANAQGVLVEGKDALVAGRWHYWRGQTLLAYELESPSLSTLQCHLLCAVYLCGGSFHNMMDNAVSTAVRTAYMLGLHLDPPPILPEREREIRRRLWWAVYVMDTKAGMKLGRPFNLHDSHVMPRLPNDSLDAARTSGSTFGPVGDNTTWLSFNLHQAILYTKVRAAYIHFYNQDLQLSNGQTIWDDFKALEASALVLPQHIEELEKWVNNIPSSLKLGRQNQGTPLSTDGTSLLIEQYQPLWLQRQRVLLELTYHHLNINLYRPFISFGLRPCPGTVAYDTMIRCVAHAITLSHITYQVLDESKILDGWHEAYHYQWNAAVTLIGFAAVYWQIDLSVPARDAVTLAISVFDNFGAKFAVAENAARVMRNLCTKVDLLVSRSRAQLDAQSLDLGMGSVDHSVDVPSGLIPPELTAGPSPSVEDSILLDPVFSSFGSEFFDTALNIDFWNDAATLWPDLDIPAAYPTDL